MTNPSWAPALWVPNPWPELPEEPPDVEPSAAGPRVRPLGSRRSTRHADWTCSCASSAWLLNSLGDDQPRPALGRVGRGQTLREATYEGAISPNYGLARADMGDLETMFNSLGYTVDRKQRITIDDLFAFAGRYPMQINGARWYHHTGLRELGAQACLPGESCAPNWRGVGRLAGCPTRPPHGAHGTC